MCPQISKPTPEDFFNAFMNYNEKTGRYVSKDSAIEMMSKHAMWLVEQAKRYVDVQSWKEFAKTKDLCLDEDVEMDEPERRRPVRCISSSSPTPPEHKRVRPSARSQNTSPAQLPRTYSHGASVLGPHLNTLQMINPLDTNPNWHPARNVHHLHP